MSIIRIDPAFDALVPRDARIEKVGGGFTFTEGPIWRPRHPETALRSTCGTTPEKVCDKPTKVR